MSVIDEIKTRIDIVDLVSETVQLRRSGKNYMGFCPFHPNSRTPAFVVFPESGTWRCFGQCNEGGDIFRFIMKREGWDFSETLRFLADRAGIQLRQHTPEGQAVVEEHDNLRTILEEAAIFYHHQLLHTATGNLALKYLQQQRGLRTEALEAFGLGYAPASWDATLLYLVSKGHSVKELLAAGLVSEREKESSDFDNKEIRKEDVYDRFRNRVMFPIRDARGRMAGFGARILNPDDVPKFLNSPQTQVFDKGRLLYGLDRARKQIRMQDQAVIVEGYLDVISLHQAGFENAVSPMGTALTEHQLYLVKRFSKRIALALDPDAAGIKATMRGVEIARQSMDRESDLFFDARGLLSHEARLQADIRVAALPEGKDPDEIVNQDPTEWQRLIENAQPVVVHVMETLSKGKNLDDPKIKHEIAEEILPLIEDIPSPIERDTYRQRLARLLRVNERTLDGLSPKKKRTNISGRRSAAAPAVPSQLDYQKTGSSGSFTLESHCLGILLRRPGLLYQVDRLLQEEDLTKLSAADFEHSDNQAIFHYLQEGLDQDQAEPQNYVLNSLSLPLMELADSLLENTARLDTNDTRVIEDLMRGLLDLRRRKINQEIEYLRFLMEDAQDENGQDYSKYNYAMRQLSTNRFNIDRAMKIYTSRLSRGHS